MMPPLYARRIKARRLTLKWSQERLARQLQLLGYDLSRSVISNIELGERQLQPDELCPFAAALDVDPNWLLDWDEYRHRNVRS